ncbi:MAG: hypothetical protein LCH84_13815 [Gemmatimonadetes bacterium]|nr:hypothetical protein [Gemmatimonadota bacterium]
MTDAPDNTPMPPAGPAPAATSSADDLQRLEQLRRALLAVHRALLDAERIRYEAVHGRIPNNSVFLQLVINDNWFEWLRPMAELVLLIDERTSDKEQPVGADEAAVLFERGIRLLRPDAAGDTFQRLFHDSMQAVPALAVQVRQAVTRLGR